MMRWIADRPWAVMLTVAIVWIAATSVGVPNGLATVSCVGGAVGLAAWAHPHESAQPARRARSAIGTVLGSGLVVLILLALTGRLG